MLSSPIGLLTLALVAIIAHEPFRWLGLYLGHGLEADSEIFVWVRAVATALVAGLVTRLVMFPVGALEGVALWMRLGALASGIAIFFIRGRHLGAGVSGGAAVLLIFQYATQ
ncbi:MAG: AzlD domain-containing protein [Alphaproteobacteria bacterium]|nr:AzlD domain-containing protein [Alphaproteobacteria bacterium]